MKKQRLIHRGALLLSMVFLLGALAGCGGKVIPTPQGSDAPQETVAAQETATPTPTPEEPGEDSVLRVSSVEELVEAIRPGAEIVIQPGRYDLMDFLADYLDTEERETWNNEHKYVQIGYTYDGPEIRVRNVTGLYIKGGSEDPGKTEIVTRPRYATVLGFYDCCDIELACLTMGHTDGGECSGNVLDFCSCQNVRLHSMDLYGCGVLGIFVMNRCRDFAVSNSTIRDCSDGPFEIYNASGDFTFTDCTFAGSGGCGWYDGAYDDGECDSSLSFVGCSFGLVESQGWYWYFAMHLDNCVTFEDCQWSEVTEYPDIDMGYANFYTNHLEKVLAFDSVEEVAFDETVLNNTFWAGYAVVDPRSGDTYYFDTGTYDAVYEDYVSMFFDADGSAWLTYRDETLDLSWYLMDEKLACLENAEHTLYVSLYQDRGAENSDFYWLLLQFDDELIWFDE